MMQRNKHCGVPRLVGDLVLARPEPGLAIAVVSRESRIANGRKPMSREQIVRDTAYAIWEAEGKPHGRDADHWRQAEARVAASLTTGAGKAASEKSPAAAAKSKASETTKAVAKPATLKEAKEPAKGRVLIKRDNIAERAPAKAAATKAAATKTAVTAKPAAAKPAPKSKS